MTVGIGVDLCDVARIEKAIAAPHGQRFVERVFTGGEIEYAESKANRAETYAGRFAAKEAAMKALGSGWSAEVGWHDIEIVRLESGQPELKLSGGAVRLAGRLGITRSFVSISHGGGQATAFVVLER